MNDVEPPARSSLYRAARRAAAIGFATNLGLGIVKLVGGTVGHSYALVSDAVNSLGDSLSGIVVLCALRVAEKPADVQHPYGHTRAEAVAALSVAILIILSAVFVGWEAIARIGQPRPVPLLWTVYLAAANVLAKEALYHYSARVGRRTGSSAILANAWDHRSDALCSLSVLVGLVIVHQAGPAYAWVDLVAALVVASVILGSGIALFGKTASELMDAQAEPSFVDQIRAAARQIDGVECIEQCRVRKTGLEYLVDLHVEVDSQLTVEEGHEVGHRVKDRLLSRFRKLRDVLVHIEPHSPEKVPRTDAAPPFRS